MATSRADTDACEFCGSTNFHLDNGLLYCDNGHEQAGGQQIADDAEEYGTQGKRTIAKKDKGKVKMSKVYRGHRAYRLFLQAYQHIIWRQCYALIHKKNLPPEVWTVVKDLWTLRLLKQAEILEKLSVRDLEEPNLSVEAGSGEGSEKEAENVSRPPGKNASKSPVLVETVALCYLGILLMRLPTGLADIYRWIRTEDIPYFRAIRHIPAEMKARLPGEYHRALDTEALISPDGLQTAVYGICALYTKEFGMSLPAINSSLLLFQYIKKLTLPLEVYPAVKNLNKILNFTFKYPLMSDSKVRRNAISHPEAQLISLLVVATKLIFPFDSGTVKRRPRSLNEPGAQRIDWRKWAERHKQGGLVAENTSVDTDEGEMRSKPILERGREAEITDADIFKMSEAELDQYMDWYQRTWTKSNDTEDNVNKELLEMFPLRPVPTEDQERDHEREIEEIQLEMVREVHATMKLSRPVTDEETRQLQQERETPVEIQRPGSHYHQYRKAEDLPETARAFYEAAAEAACMSMERLVKAVLQTEGRMKSWGHEKRRAERFEENEEDEYGDVVEEDGG